MPALDEIFFVIKGKKIFPFQTVQNKKTNRTDEIARIENKFINQRGSEIKSTNKDLLLWLDIQNEVLT